MPRRVLAWADYLGIRSVAPPNDNHDPRQYMDNPDSEELGEDVAELKPEPTDGIL